MSSQTMRCHLQLHIHLQYYFYPVWVYMCPITLTKRARGGGGIWQSCLTVLFSLIFQQWFIDGKTCQWSEYLIDQIHCSKKLKEHFFIRVWHDFNCTSLIMMWSVKQQRGLLISFRCIGVDGINNRCTRGATMRRPPKQDWFCMWRVFQVSPSWSLWLVFH